MINTEGREPGDKTRKPGWYWVKKIANSAAYQDLDPWDIALWDDMRGYWLKSGSMGVWPESYFDEIDERQITRTASTGETQEQWISVKKRLPKFEGDVLSINVSGFQHVAYFHFKSKKFTRKDGRKVDGHLEIAYWMPLPEPPSKPEPNT